MMVRWSRLQRLQACQVALSSKFIWWSEAEHTFSYFWVMEPPPPPTQYWIFTTHEYQSGGCVLKLRRDRRQCLVKLQGRVMYIVCMTFAYCILLFNSWEWRKSCERVGVSKKKELHPNKTMLAQLKKHSLNVFIAFALISDAIRHLTLYCS